MHYTSPSEDTRSPYLVTTHGGKQAWITKKNPGLDFIEGFSLLAGAIWIIGALLLGAMVMLGLGRV